MDPITIAMLGAGILTGGAKTWIGASRKKEARERREELLADQPQYETPVSLEQMTSLYGNYLARVERTRGFPGQRQMEQDLSEQTSSRIRDIRETARSSTEALGATTDLISREIEMLQQLDIQGAKYAAEQQLQARQMYGQALGQQAQYEDRAWQYNEWMPWRTELAQAQAQYRGGQRTMESGLSDIVGTFGQAAKLEAQANWFEEKEEEEEDENGNDFNLDSNFLSDAQKSLIRQGKI